LITVSILINGQPIFTRSAVRVVTGEPNQYRVDDGSLIEHHYDAGAVALAHKLLDSIREPKHAKEAA
jgi:hypothetical protein